ncbi:MAG: TRAP transporter small permease subunit [Betaproteobacteria bacterium]
MPIGDRLRSLSDRLNTAVIAVCIACVLAMLAISFAGFLYMAATGEALSWTYSLARLFIPWIGMLSITVAFRSGEHVAMSLLLRLAPRGVAAALRWTVVALIALFALLLVWFGWDFFVGSNRYYMVSDQIQIHAGWVTACIPITGVILLLHLVNGPDLLEPLHPETERD